MKEKIELFRKSLKLVWESAPGWTLANSVLSVLRSLLPLILLWLIKILIDEITTVTSPGSGSNYVKITWMIIAVVITYFLDETSSDLSSFVRRKQAIGLESFMYDLLHNKSIRLDLINFEHPGYYDCLSRAAAEAPWRPNSILNNIISMFRASVSLSLMAAVLTTLHWGIALLLVLVNVPGIWLRLHYAGILYNFRRDQTPEARKAAYFNWLVTGDRPSRELRLFGLGKYFAGNFKKSFLKQKDEEMIIIRKRTLIELVTDAVKATAILAMLLFIAQQTIKGALSLGQMAMFLLAFRQGMSYIKELLGSVAGLYEDSLFIGDTFEFLNLEEKVIAIPPVINVNDFNDRISVENITFTYPGNKAPTINNVSFELNKGEIIAIAGPNGAGKSTLVRLLTRLYDPGSGIVKIDGINIKNIDPEQYRKLFSVIFQDFMLYNLSAGENIRLGDNESPADEERIKHAAESTGIHDLISSLPEGYNTTIGNLFDDSRELSWGEWQKIALSRALYRDARVIILDEPSSALDASTEFEVLSKFREIVRGRTTILISHRLSNIMMADRIIVLDKGRITESGTHDELIKKGGVYSDMYSKQSNRF